MSEHREVRVKPGSHQPSKPELEEDLRIRRRDGSRPTPEEVARVALRLLTVVEDPDA